MREKLQQRVKDLARAQQTATSDPAAKEDITDVGDMEIDSDTEALEPVDAKASAPPTHPPPVSQPHPLLQQHPPPLIIIAQSLIYFSYKVSHIFNGRL